MATTDVTLHLQKCINDGKLQETSTKSQLTYYRMSAINHTPVSDDSWMYKEVTDVKLVELDIFRSMEYARQKMGEIRRILKMKRITAKTYAEFYRIDIGLFYGLKKM